VHVSKWTCSSVYRWLHCHRLQVVICHVFTIIGESPAFAPVEAARSLSFLRQCLIVCVFRCRVAQPFPAAAHNQYRFQDFSRIPKTFSQDSCCSPAMLSYKQQLLTLYIECDSTIRCKTFITSCKETSWQRSRNTSYIYLHTFYT